MATVFLHTADWQLGKPFGFVGQDPRRFRLQDQRIQTIRALAATVRQSGASFVIVAGDLFDSPHVTRATVSAACGAIGALGVPVFAIPGNHDLGGPGSLWEQEFFLREQRQLAPNLRVLLTPEPVVLESAVLLPAPRRRRHESADPTVWIRQGLLDPALPDDRPRIVLAHGATQDFGAQQDEDDERTPGGHRIDLDSLPDSAVDFIALGDWHGTKQVGAKAWYSGTPEIDRFPKGAGNDPGNVLVVEASRGNPPQVTRHPTTRFKWLEFGARLSGDDSLPLVREQVDSLVADRPDDRLLLLTLEGAAGLETARQLDEWLETLGARLLHLRIDQRITVAPSEEEIAALTRRSADPLIAAVAETLVSKCRADTEEAAVARLALRELHAALTA